MRTKQANRMVREQIARERRRRRNLVVSIAAAAVLVIAGFVGWAVYASQAPKASGYATPVHATKDGTGIQVSTGSKTVDFYHDFLCPICKQVHADMKSTLDGYTSQNKITLIYHPIAILDDRTTPSGYSTRAGAAAACASDENKFPQYFQALYDQQPGEGSAGLSNDQLVQIGKSVGLTDNAFAQCVTSQKYAGWMAHNTDTAAGKNIQSTPTILVNGKQIDNTVDALKRAVGS